MKVLEHWLGKSKIKMDEATKLRDELRVQLDASASKITALQAEVDKWREEYYDLRDKYSTLNTEYLIALEKIKEEVKDAQQRANKDLDLPHTV